MDTLLGSTFVGRCQPMRPPLEMSFITGSITAFFILTNVPGNILVILAVVVDPNRNLRTPFNYLVANLAAADLMVGFLGQPLAVYFHFKEALDVNGLNPKVAKLIIIVYFITCTASVLSLSSLAVERYLAVRKPNTYRNKVTKKRIAATISAIWFISLTLPNVNLTVGFPTFAFIFANTCVVVGVTIICATYFLMKRKVMIAPQSNHHSTNDVISISAGRKPSQHGNSTHVVANPSFLLNVNLNDERLSEIHLPPTSTKANICENETKFQALSINPIPPNSIAHAKQLLEAKVTEMFLIVIAGLVCCYGPATLMIYIVHLCKDCSCNFSHCLMDISVLLSFLNSSVNFYCYALRSSKFRRAFSKLLKVSHQRNNGVETFKNTQEYAGPRRPGLI